MIRVRDNQRRSCPGAIILFRLGVAHTVAMAVAMAAGAEFHVATNGNDGWSGTLPAPNQALSDGPFATLSKARDAIRDADRKDGARVIIHAGTYRAPGSVVLGPEDSGTASHATLWVAAPGDQPRLSGGVEVPATAWRRPQDARQTARMAEEARAHILVADLAPLGVPALAPLPDRYRGAPSFPELFFNDTRMDVARWPNEGWATVARIVDAGSNPREGDTSNKPGVFAYDGDRPSRWNAAAGVWLQGYWCFDWYEEVLKVRSIDSTRREVTFTGPHMYSLKQGNPSPRRFCALNLLEELDRPGEYYLDAAARLLYFWPPGDVATARVELSLLNEPVLTLTNASHVSIEGLTFEAGLADGVAVEGGLSNRLAGCVIRNFRQTGARVTGGHGHLVESCDIYDTGTGGLRLEGGDRPTLAPGGHLASNNHIHDFSRHQFTSAYGLSLGGVGNRAMHNLIHDAPHQAVFVGGNDHVFELNEVYAVCLETDDCGALYKGRNPSCRGNTIRNNFWHHIGKPMGHGSAAIYFDDGDGGDLVEGNVFLRCGDPGRGSFGTVFSHGGHDLRAEGNIFIECKRALGSVPWGDKSWKEAVEGGADCGWTEKLLKEVDITKPPYTTRYPELRGFMTPGPEKPRFSRATANVFVRCRESTNGNWRSGEGENWSLDGDPGFNNPGRTDFSLKTNSDVFAKLPAFKPIPFPEIGLRTSEHRRDTARVVARARVATGWDAGAPLPVVISRGAASGSYQAFPDVCRLPNGHLLCVFYAGYTHISWPKEGWPNGGRIAMVRSRDEGRTWSEPKVLFDGPMDDRDPHIAAMRDGTLICSFFTYRRKDPKPGATDGECATCLVTSRDGGDTWDSEARVVAADWPSSAPVREMPDGTRLLGVYHEDGPMAYGGVIRSTDSGRTWSAPISIGEKSGVRLDAETDTILLTNGVLYAALRGDRTNMHFATSADLGLTWSGVKDIGFPGHCPHLNRLSTGEILLVHRLPKTALHISRDEGATWLGPFLIDNTIGAYPSTVELRDHTVLIVYYEEGEGSGIRARRFRLGKTGGIEFLNLDGLD